MVSEEVVLAGIRKAIGALAIAVLLRAALLGIGCGGGDDSGSERAVGWGVERQLGPKSLRLAGTVEVCWAPVQVGTTDRRVRGRSRLYRTPPHPGKGRRGVQWLPPRGDFDPPQDALPSRAS